MGIKAEPGGIETLEDHFLKFVFNKKVEGGSYDVKKWDARKSSQDKEAAQEHSV